MNRDSDTEAGSHEQIMVTEVRSERDTIITNKYITIDKNDLRILRTMTSAEDHQQQEAHRLNLEISINIADIAFRFIPSGAVPGIDSEMISNHSAFYLAETPVSELHWSIITSDQHFTDYRAEKAGQWSPNNAKVGISILDVRKFLSTIDKQAKALNSNFSVNFPTDQQWAFCASLTQEVEIPYQRDPGSTKPLLQKTQPSAFGLYDLFGVVYQFCKRSDKAGGYVKVGGCYLDVGLRTKDLHDIRITNEGSFDHTTGFRPAISLSANA